MVNNMTCQQSFTKTTNTVNANRCHVLLNVLPESEYLSQLLKSVHVVHNKPGWQI